MATLLEITPNQPGMTRDGQRFCARTAALMLNAPLGWETGFPVAIIRKKMRATGEGRAHL